MRPFLTGCALLAVIALFGAATSDRVPTFADEDLRQDPFAEPPPLAAEPQTPARPAAREFAMDSDAAGSGPVILGGSFVPASDIGLPALAQVWPGSRPQQAQQRPLALRRYGLHEFFFTRAIYSESRGRGRSWATDYPKADLQFVSVVDRLIDIDISFDENAIELDDPNVRRFPFLYMLEVGDIRLTEAEVEGLRNYLLAGGFLVVDDFWGTRQWSNFEREMRRVFPDRAIIDIPMDHQIFDMVYTIEELVQVPAIGNWVDWGRTWEQDGYVPYVRGILDDKGRIMVLINWNTDLGDAWEWAERPEYPLEFSTYAFRMGVNFIVYAMSY